MSQEQSCEGLSGQVGVNLSEDPRAAHTRAVLRTALICLLEHGDWGAISVAGICRRAGVARSSFYEHYATKSDLLDAVFAEVMQDIGPPSRSEGPLATLDWLVDHVAGTPGFFARAMAGGRGDTLFPRFRTLLIDRLADELSVKDIAEAKAKAGFIIGGTMTYLADSNVGPNRDFIQSFAYKIIG